jgi:hypothetical protein
VAAAPTEITIGFTSKRWLRLRDWFDRDFRLLDKIFESPTRDWIAAAVDDDGGLDKIRGRYPARPGPFDSSGKEKRSASGSLRRIAMIAEVSLIISAGRVGHTKARHDRQI